MYVVWAKSPRCLLCILGGSLFSAVMAFPCENVHAQFTVLNTLPTSSLAKLFMILLL